MYVTCSRKPSFGHTVSQLCRKDSIASINHTRKGTKLNRKYETKPIVVEQRQLTTKSPKKIFNYSACVKKTKKKRREKKK